MLSLISPAKAVMPVCAQYPAGAFLAQAGAAASHERSQPVFSAAAFQAVAGPRPRPREDAMLSGYATRPAGETILVPQPQSSQKNDAHQTRIAAAGGGAQGPHPARDPV